METLKNGNEYLTLISTDEKGTLRNYIELWDKISNLIETSDKPGEHNKKFMQIKLIQMMIYL